MRTSDPYVASFELAVNHSRMFLYASAYTTLSDARHSAKVTASDHNQTGYHSSSMWRMMGGEGSGIHRRSSASIKARRVRVVLSSASKSSLPL
jgi:hypothetical protein